MAIRTFEGVTPEVHPTAWVDETALVIGHVTIGADSSVWPTTVLRGDINRITVGERSNIQDGCVVHVNHASQFNPEGAPVTIGNDVTVGHKAILHACTVHDRCLIGMGATVLDEAVIPSDVIVGAGSLVPPGRELESGFLWLGSPARKVRELTEQELTYLRYSAEYYAELKERHRQGK